MDQKYVGKPMDKNLALYARSFCKLGPKAPFFKGVSVNPLTLRYFRGRMVRFSNGF